MGVRTIEWDRQKLYEQVWQKPGVQLAKEYGISDVALAKVCKKLNVPRPKPGDWTRMQCGHKVNKPALPAMQEAPTLVSEILVADDKETKQPDAYLALLATEKDSPQIIVCSDLKTLRPLSAHSLKELRKGTSYQGLMQPPSWRECLDIQVSQASLERTVMLFDAIIRALETRGHKVTLAPQGKHSTVVLIEHEAVAFGIKEKISWVKRELTPEEQREQEKWHYFTTKYDYNPTGRLTIAIKGDDGWGVPQAEWSDGKRKRLEDKLNDAVIGLIYAGMHKKQRRLEAEQRQREHQDLERQRWQKLELIRAEEQRVELLKRQADNWDASQRIRSFVDAVRIVMQNHSDELIDGKPVLEWIGWAFAQADRLDPLKRSPPSILDEKAKWQHD